MYCAVEYKNGILTRRKSSPFLKWSRGAAGSNRATERGLQSAGTRIGNGAPEIPKANVDIQHLWPQSRAPPLQEHGSDSVRIGIAFHPAKTTMQPTGKTQSGDYFLAGAFFADAFFAGAFFAATFLSGAFFATAFLVTAVFDFFEVSDLALAARSAR